MQTELFRPPAAVSHQHFHKSRQAPARPPIDNQVRVVQQPAAARLHLVHQGVFFIRIQRLIEPARLDQRRTARQQIAEYKFLFTRLAQPAHRLIPGAAGTKGQPAPHYQGEDPFQPGRFRRAKGRAADHLRFGPAEKRRRPTQIVRRRRRVVIEKINPFTARFAEGGIALDGRVMAAGHDDFQPVARIIQLPAGRDRFDLGLIRARGNDHRHRRQRFAHGNDRRGESSRFKGSSSREISTEKPQ